MTNLSTILFDLDGTLLNTAPDLASALNQVLVNHQKPILPFEQIRPIVSSGSRAILNLGLDLSDEQKFYALRKEFLQAYDRCLAHQTTIYDNIEKVITSIENAGLYWGIVTNKPFHLAKKLLTHFQVLNRYNCLVGGDQVVNPKPAAESLLLACQHLRVKPSECIYIGDHERDAQAAKAANMLSIIVLYGYIPPNTDPKDWGADYYAATCDEISQHIMTLLP